MLAVILDRLPQASVYCLVRAGSGTVMGPIRAVQNGELAMSQYNELIFVGVWIPFTIPQDVVVMHVHLLVVLFAGLYPAPGLVVH
jgi:hypothetical protein